MGNGHTGMVRWVALLAWGIRSAAAVTVDFEQPTLPDNSYWNGSDGAGGVTVQPDVFCGNFYIYYADWGMEYWSGFALSTVQETNTLDYTNQYAVMSGTGAGDSRAYAVLYEDTSGAETDVLTLPRPARVQGFMVNNTTYAALAMRHGYLWAKRFGGATGTDPDWFRLTITGCDLAGRPLGSVTHYLADFRFTNSAEDYIQTEWRWVDLTPLGNGVKTLHFALASSDTGAFMNTPAYCALDRLAYDYPPAAGAPGSTAVHYRDHLFTGWAAGWTNYEPGARVEELYQTPENALGAPVGEGDEDAFHIVSLGEGGAITLVFDPPIADGPGPDFAVFENAQADTFLELGWVEVSSDGLHFQRFPSHSLTAAPVGGYGSVYTTNITGMAGKYRIGYGTPFDLAELAPAPELDAQGVRWVRVRDIVGDGSCTDSFGRAIYDPYPTFGSGGFDLDAVGVINTPWRQEPVRRLADGVRVAWTAQTNRLYLVQWTDDLPGGAWRALGGAVTGRNDAVAVTDTNRDAALRIYRVLKAVAP